MPQPVVRGAKRVLYPKKCVGRIASERGALLLASWVKISLPSQLFTSQKLSVHTTLRRPLDWTLAGDGRRHRRRVVVRRPHRRRFVVATLLCWVITSLSVSAGGVTLPTSRHRGSMVEGAPQPSDQCVAAALALVLALALALPPLSLLALDLHGAALHVSRGDPPRALAPRSPCATPN